MNASKTFSFATGWSLTVSCQAGGLRFAIAHGDERMELSAQDALTLRRADGLRGVAEAAGLPRVLQARLLDGLVSWEEDENSLLLHACPRDAQTQAPIASLMAHYRLERAGENAVRITTWFGGEAPLTESTLTWMCLKAPVEDFTRLAGFDPDWSAPARELSHNVHFGSAALVGPKGYVMLTDCGEATFQPNAGRADRAVWRETPDGAALCALAARPGNLRRQDLALLDEAHPLCAVLAFGEGQPEERSFAANPLPTAAGPAGTEYRLTSGRLTMGVRAWEDGVSLLGISLEDFSATAAAPLLPLCTLTLQDLETGGLVRISSEREWAGATIRATQHRLSVYLERPSSIDLSVFIEARATANDTIEWRTRVLNSSPRYTVRSATYPPISFSGGENICLFKPSASGRVEKNAYAREERWEGTYPSGFEGVVPVLGAYNPEKKRDSGLYVAIHAPEAARTDMSCAFFRRGQGVFRYEYPAEHMGTPANAFELHGCLVVSVLDGDWFDMARIYGAYLAGHAQWYKPLGREDSPAWMKDVPLYIMDWMPNDNPDAGPVPISIRPPVEPPRDNWYKKPIALARRLGLPMGYHLYNWHWIPFNNDYPYYFPVKEGLREGVEEMHKYGIRVMPYINGRIADTRDSRGETVRFERELLPGATKQLDGALDIETYASHEPDGSLCRLAAMCPTSPAWRETLAEIARKLFREYHMDAIYIDQVAAACVNLCCDPTHAHTPGNGEWWVRAYRLLMERLRQECPEGCGFTTESNAEPYADQFDGFLTWAWVFPNMVPFFPALYAGRIALLGRNTNGYKKGDAQYFRFHAAQAVMFGQQIGWMNADVVDDAGKIDFLERMCHMRWEHRAFFSQGEMLRPPRIAGGQSCFLTDSSMGMDDMQPADTVVASAWREGKNTMLAIANSGDAPARIHLVFDAQEYHLGPLAETRAYGAGEDIAVGEGSIRAHIGARSCLVFLYDPVCAP